MSEIAPLRNLFSLIALAIVLAVPATADAGSVIDRNFATRGIQSLNLGMDRSDSNDGIRVINSAAGRKGEIFVLSGGGFRSRSLEISKVGADGKLNRSFGSRGVAYLHFKADRNIDGGAIAIDRKGRILLAGTTREECGTHGCTPSVALLRLSPSGKFDPKFRGRKIYSGPAGTGQDLIVRKNGTILVGGNDRGDFNLSRFRADGSLDRGFGRAGVGTAEAESRGSSGNRVRGMALDGKGRVVMLASTRGRGYFGRFKPNGRADRRFGVSGVTQSGKAENAKGIVVLKSGRIVTAVEDPFFNSRCSQLFALRKDGEIDVAFNRAAEEAVGNSCNEEIASSIASLELDPAGRMTLIGSIGNDTFRSEKYNDDGSRITAYGASGVAIFPGGRGGVTDGLLDSRGRAVAVGTERQTENGRIGRFTLQGKADSSFGEDGSSTWSASPPSEDEGGKVIAAGGGLLVAGKTSARYQRNTGSDTLSISRLRSNGKPDRSFGTGGRIITSYGALREHEPLFAYAGGAIFAAGTVDESVGEDYRSAFRISKYDRKGKPARGWANDGVSTGDFGRQAKFLIGQPKGGVLLVNQTRGGATVSRMTPGGKLDSRYGGIDGVANLRIPHDSSASTGVAAVSADPRGRPLLAITRGICKGSGCGTNEAVILRLNKRGRIDRSFGPGGQVVLRTGSADAISAATGNRIVVTGTRCKGELDYKCPRERVVLVLGPNGRPDGRFGRRGQAVFPIRDVKVEAAVTTPAGVVLGGTRNDRPALLGFTGRGRTARSFGRRGMVQLKAGLSGDIASLTRSRGRIIGAGTIRTPDEAANFLTIGFRGP